MEKEISKTQIDQLGKRLKKGENSEVDLRLLEQYRQSFRNAYEFVERAIRDQLLLEPTGRAGKTTQSIGDKLRRENIRITQIQDIAGCRLIARDIIKQDEVTALLCNVFEDVTIVDRRKNTSHGYRAIHVIVRVHGKPIEIQLRTELQHLWAELSEKYSDIVDPLIKYGAGHQAICAFLKQISDKVSIIESIEWQRAKLKVTDVNLQELYNQKQEWINELQSLYEELRQTRQLKEGEEKYFNDLEKMELDLKSV